MKHMRTGSLIAASSQQLLCIQPFVDPGLQRTHLQLLGMKRRGEGIMRMENAMTSEEEDTDSQDFSIPTGHAHLARNCLMKIITLATKAIVISVFAQLGNSATVYFEIQLVYDMIFLT